MDEYIMTLINDRRTMLCLFKPGYLLEMHNEDIYTEEKTKGEPEMEDYAMRQLNDVLWRITNYLSMSCYPMKYKDMLYSELNELSEIKDSNRAKRRDLIRETKANLNLCINNKDYFKGFLGTLFGEIIVTIDELDLDPKKKEEKINFVKAAITALSTVDKKDDPDDNIKQQIYTDVYNALMPNVEEGMQLENEDAEVELLCFLSDTVDLVNEFKGDGLYLYEKQLAVRGLPHDPLTMDDIEAAIETIVKWAKIEKDILLTHPHHNFFDEYPHLMKPFITLNGYYKAIQNILLEYNGILKNRDFVSNTMYVFSLRDDTNNVLRTELALTLRLTQEDCFGCEEALDIAREYSSDEDFYEYLKRIFINYKTLAGDKTFLENVRRVVSLNQRRARKSLGRRDYKYLTELFSELDEKG